MEWLGNLFNSDVFKGGTNLVTGVMNFLQYLMGLFMKNPLWFLGGLVLLRVSKKGFKFNLKDLFNVKL